MHRYRSTRKKLLSYSPLRRGFPGPGPAHCAYPTRARTWTRPGASSRTVEHKDQLFAEPRLVVHSCPAFGRVHCCHVRLPRPRPGHTLKRGEHLGGSSAPLSSRRISLALIMMTVTSTSASAIGPYTNVSFLSSAADGSSHQCTVYNRVLANSQPDRVRHSCFLSSDVEHTTAVTVVHSHVRLSQLVLLHCPAAPKPLVPIGGRVNVLHEQELASAGSLRIPLPHKLIACLL